MWHCGSYVVCLWGLIRASGYDRDNQRNSFHCNSENRGPPHDREVYFKANECLHLLDAVSLIKPIVGALAFLFSV